MSNWPQSTVVPANSLPIVNRNMSNWPRLPVVPTNSLPIVPANSLPIVPANGIKSDAISPASLAVNGTQFLTTSLDSVDTSVLEPISKLEALRPASVAANGTQFLYTPPLERVDTSVNGTQTIHTPSLDSVDTSVLGRISKSEPVSLASTAANGTQFHHSLPPLDNVHTSVLESKSYMANFDAETNSGEIAYEELLVPNQWLYMLGKKKLLLLLLLLLLLEKMYLWISIMNIKQCYTSNSNNIPSLNRYETFRIRYNFHILHSTLFTR